MIKLTVPPPLRTCAADPPPPLGDNAEQVRRWIIALWAAGQDCRDKIAAIDRFLALLEAE